MTRSVFHLRGYDLVLRVDGEASLSVFALPLQQGRGVVAAEDLSCDDRDGGIRMYHDGQEAGNLYYGEPMSLLARDHGLGDLGEEKLGL